MYGDGLWICMRCLKDAYPLLAPAGFGPDCFYSREMYDNPVGGVSWCQEQKCVVYGIRIQTCCSLSVCSQHDWACMMFALRRPNVAMASVPWQTDIVSEPPSQRLCSLWSHGPRARWCVRRGVGLWGRGRPSAFHLLTGSLAPLAALYSTVWTSILSTDNFILRKVQVPASMCACML